MNDETNKCTTERPSGSTQPDCSVGHPPVEHVAWVFAQLREALKSDESYSFRYLIYDKMGFKPEDYKLLYQSGGMHLTNALCELHEFRALSQNAKADSHKGG